MNKSQALKEVQSAPIGASADRVCELLRPCIRMCPQTGTMDKADIKGSRFGGRILLPPNVEWPQWDSADHFAPLIEHSETEIKQIKAVQQRQGIHEPSRYAQQEQWLDRSRKIIAGGPRRMNFLARVCLKDLTGLQCGLDLPKTGVLSVFYDVVVRPGGWAWSRDGWRIVYSDDEEEIDLGEDENAPWRGRWLPIGFSEEWTLPTDVDRASPGMELGEEYDFLGERLRGEWGETHHLGGWADEIQGDAGPPEAICQKADWILLMQLSSDAPWKREGLGWMWGDGGRLYFWIRRDHLAVRQFDSVWCGFQCG
jgi:Domain of unknown function (DUF1963)